MKNFWQKAGKLFCQTQVFMFADLFPTTLTFLQVWSSSFVTVNVNDRKHTACYELRCIGGKSTFVDLVQTQMRREVSEVVRSGHCQCRTNIHSATSSSELCCYASSTCVSSHTWTHKVDSHPSMQHPGVRGESSGDHDLAISLTNLASCSILRQKQRSETIKWNSCSMPMSYIETLYWHFASLTLEYKIPLLKFKPWLLHFTI